MVNVNFGTSPIVHLSPHPYMLVQVYYSVLMNQRMIFILVCPTNLLLLLSVAFCGKKFSVASPLNWRVLPWLLDTSLKSSIRFFLKSFSTIFFLRCIIFFDVYLVDHPYFVGVQFHPEFSSRPMKPSPPYLGLLLAATGTLNAYLQRGCKLSPR